MKIITKTIEVYGFSELGNDAKKQAINDCIHCMLEDIEYDNMTENMRKAIGKAENMKTPWFAGSYVYEYCLNEIMENVNGYSYLIDGSIYIDN